MDQNYKNVRINKLAEELNNLNSEWMYLNMCEIVELFSDPEFCGCESLTDNAEWKEYIFDNEEGYLQVRIIQANSSIGEETEEYDYQCFEDHDIGIDYLNELKDEFYNRWEKNNQKEINKSNEREM